NAESKVAFPFRYLSVCVAYADVCHFVVMDAAKSRASRIGARNDRRIERVRRRRKHRHLPVLLPSPHAPGPGSPAPPPPTISPTPAPTPTASSTPFLMIRRKPYGT